jgi:RHS repeat-associated protein
MNSRHKKLARILVSLILFLTTLQIATAYYDPGVQRWINRDPFGEVGFEKQRGGLVRLEGNGPNGYHFVHNRPVCKTDILGLSECTDECKRSAQNRQGSINCFANYAGAIGAAGGFVGGGLYGAGRGRAISTAIIGAIGGALWWVGSELVGTAGNLAAYVACLSACGHVDNPENTADWPPPY